MPVPRVLIRTLPLARGNYGGILQAFGLQRAITDLGFRVDTDISARLAPKDALRRQLTSAASRVLGRPVGYWHSMESVNVDVLAFVDRHMTTTRLFDRFGRPRADILAEYDSFVTGSDQVWRPEYGDVGSYLLDFLQPDSEAARVAYAASFGTDAPTSDLARHASAASRLTAVSVREKSGVRLAAEYWGIDSTQMPDPTLLLEVSDYEALLTPVAAAGEMYLATYVLDPDGTKGDVVAAISDVFGLRPRELGRATAGRAPYQPATVQHRKPGVEEWLSGIRSAELVITDSFHGCVFSIMFGRPFIAIGNAARGMTRFESLFETFGLSDRLMALTGDIAADARTAEAALRRDIDWVEVNQIRSRERARGLDFLGASLKRS